MTMDRQIKGRSGDAEARKRACQLVLVATEPEKALVHLDHSR